MDSKFIWLCVAGFVVGMVCLILWKASSDINTRCNKACHPYKVAYCELYETGCYTDDPELVKIKRLNE